MANLTPVEQDDSLAVTRLEITDPVLGYDPGNPGAGDGKANEQAQKIANTLLYLRRRVGVQGNWDMTGVAADVAPDIAYNLQMTTATITAAQYTGTPDNGGSLIKLAGSGTITKESAARSARLRASTNGGNFALSALVFANSDATPADVAASIGFGPSGTCTHFAAVILDNAALLGPGAMKVAVQTGDPINGNNTETIIAAGGYVALDQIYVTFDGTTGLFSATVNAGSPVAGTNAWDITGAASLRAYVLGYHTANPPSLPDLAYDFDFSDNTSGRVGFQTLSNPVVPSGAADGKRYLVSVAGSYNGRSAAVGDIVEFHTALAAIQVLPALTGDAAWLASLATNTAEIDALVAAYITANPDIILDPIVAYDLTTEYATVGGVNPGEFEIGLASVRSTMFASAGTTITSLGTYGAGYTPALGDWFNIVMGAYPQGASLTVAPEVVRAAIQWPDARSSPSVLMRTPGKTYRFEYTDVAGTNYWMLMNPDEEAYNFNPTISSFQIIQALGGSGLQPFGAAYQLEQTTDVVGEVYLPNAGAFADANVVEPRGGTTWVLCIDSSSLGVIRFMTNSAFGAVTIKSNLPVFTFGAEQGVTIADKGVTVRVTYLGNSDWFVDAEQIAPLQIVRHKDQLPAAVAGVIEISSGRYLFAAQVDIGTDYIDLSGTATLMGIDRQTGVTGNHATYTIRKKDGAPRCIDLRIVNAQAGAYGVSGRDVGSACSTFVKNCSVESDHGVATSGTGSITVTESSIRDGSDHAIDFNSAAPSSVTIRNNSLRSAAASKACINMASASPAGVLNVGGNTFDIDHASAKGIEGGATIFTAAEVLRLVSNVFQGAGVANALSGIAVYDDAVQSTNNYGIENTRSVGNLVMTNNATATAVVTVNVPLKVAGTTTAGAAMLRFSHSTNRLTYTGAKTGLFSVHVSANVQTAGNNETYTVVVAKNGSVVADTEMTIRCATAGEAYNVSTFGVISLAENDYVEVFIANNTNAADPVVQDLRMIAREV